MFIPKGSTGSLYERLVQGLTRKYLQGIIKSSRIGGKPLYVNIQMSTGEERAKLSSLSISSDSTTYGIPRYSFIYDSEKINVNNVNNTELYGVYSTDSWGHFNGKSIIHGEDPKFSIQPPSLKYTKAETLKTIKYPTGGSSIFEYELNTYSKKVSPSHNNIVYTSGTAGGLRVASITNTDINKNVVSKKKYYYSQERPTISNPYPQSSGISKGDIDLSVTYKSAKSPDQWVTIKSIGGFQTPVTNMNSPDVGYSSVIEETFDKDNKSMGYIRYRYSNYDADIFGQTHTDENFYYSNSSSGNYSFLPYSSHAMQRGRLNSEEYFNPDGKLLKKSEYLYSESADVSFITGLQQTVFLSNNLYKWIQAEIGWLTRTYTAMPLLAKRTVTNYALTGNTGFAITTNYTYNSHKLLKSESTTNSDGGMFGMSYKYPDDYSEYSFMSNRHILTTHIETTELRNNKTVKSQRCYYDSTNTRIPYIKRACEYFNGDIEKESFTVLETDDYGNPIEILSDGKYSILIWADNGQRLVGKVENARCKDLLGNSMFIEISALSSKTHSEAEVWVDAIRNELTYAKVSTYGYNSDNQLAYITAPTCDH